MSSLVMLSLVAGFGVGSAVFWRFVERQLERADVVVYDLRFPRGLPDEDVAAFVSALSGLLPPWWKRWYSAPAVVIETEANSAGIRQRLLVSASHRHTVENALQCTMPSVRYTLLEEAPKPAVNAAAAYRLSTRRRPLRVDAAQLSRGLLTALQPLDDDESLLVQWTLTPAGPVPPARRASPPQGSGLSLSHDTGMPIEPEAVAALKAKFAASLVVGTARIGAAAKSRERAQSLLRRAEAPWHAARAPGVQLRRRWLPLAWVARSLRGRSLPIFGWPLLLNSEELTGLLGFPVEAEQIPGLVLGGCRQLAASPLIASRGLVVGVSTFPGSERPIAIDVQAQLRHQHLIGPTGTGKSTAMIGQIVQNLQAGVGVTVLDPKGDLVADLLARIPEDRQDDVILLDASDEEMPVGLNPLRSASGSGEVMVENLVGLMHSLWSHSWGPRLDDILRAALLTLVQQNQGMTLVEVAPLLLSESFRRRCLGRLDDPVGLESFWGWYQGLSDAERATVVAAPLNKLRAFTMRPRLRRILGQSEPKLDMAEVLSGGKILLVNLASGVLGEDAAALLGSILVAELWHATTARAAIPPEERRLHVAYLDEFQHFLNMPTPVATVLAEARGLGLGLVLAHQHLHQLSTEVREGVLANARSRLIFQCAAGDARALSKELGTSLTPDDLQGLGAYEVVASLFAGGQIAPPCTVRTLPAPESTSDPNAIRQLSRSRYGTPAADVDAAIVKRSAGTNKATPVGTTSRPRRPRKQEGGRS